MFLPAIAAMVLSGAQVHTDGLLGLTLNFTVHPTRQEMIDDVLMERRLGCKIMQDSIKWSDIERRPGQIDLAKVKEDFGNHVKLGFTTFVTLQTIDTNNRTLPPDLMAEAWDSPKMLAREKRMLTAMAAILPPTTRAFMLGNEVDAYLAAHPDELDAYLRYLDVGRETLKALKPNLDVGVTTTYSGLAANRDMIRQLQRGMDLVSMTYYPLGSGFDVLPVAKVASHFDEMVAFCGQRKLYVQECGYPASPLLGSSEAKQSAFVDAVFDAFARHRTRLAGLCYFFLCDFSDALVDQLTGYYGLHDAKFVAFLATLGLKDQYGKPRLAFAEFEKRAVAFTR